MFSGTRNNFKNVLIFEFKCFEIAVVFDVNMDIGTIRLNVIGVLPFDIQSGLKLSESCFEQWYNLFLMLPMEIDEKADCLWGIQELHDFLAGPKLLMLVFFFKLFYLSCNLFNFNGINRVVGPEQIFVKFGNLVVDFLGALSEFLVLFIDRASVRLIVNLTEVFYERPYPKTTRTNYLILLLLVNVL